MSLIRKDSFFRNKDSQSLLIATASIIIIGTIVFHFVEDWKWIDAIYFSVITLTTVGYGDFAPQTDFGKLFTVFYVLSGIGIMFGFINAFYQHRVDTKNQSIRKKNIKKNKKL